MKKDDNSKELNRYSDYVICSSTRGKDKDWFRIRINGIKTRYWINRNGQVKTFTDTLIDPFISGGYYRYKLIIRDIDGKLKTYSASKHRLLAGVFIPISRKYLKMGYQQENLVVNHKDGNKLNDDLDNLEWVTQAENNIHAIMMGLSDPKIGFVSGEDSHLSKISEETATRICELIQDGLTNNQIVTMLDDINVTEKIIQHIRSGETWKQLSANYNFPKLGNAKPNTYTDEQIHTVCRLLSTGKFNYSQIEKMTGLNQSYIKDIRDGRRRAKISSQYTFPILEEHRQHKYTTNQIKQVCEMLQDGIKVRKIVETTGLSEPYVRGIKARRTQTEISSQYEF